LITLYTIFLFWQYPIFVQFYRAIITCLGSILGIVGEPYAWIHTRRTKNTRAIQAQGITPHSNEIGILDFLRELATAESTPPVSQPCTRL
jgi:hypothetical protein